MMPGLVSRRNLLLGTIGLLCYILQVLKGLSKIAEHLAEGFPAEKAILIDVFAGAGGNAIAFARSGRWKRVYAIEKDPKVLACAKHNAEVYGVHEKISWYEGDCFETIKKELAELGEFSVIFASPPWGGTSLSPSVLCPRILTREGPGYRSDSIFNLSSMQPYTLTDILLPFQRFSNDIALYLPRTSDLRQLTEEANENRKVTVVHYCMEGASKASELTTNIKIANLTDA